VIAAEFDRLQELVAAGRSYDFEHGGVPVIRNRDGFRHKDKPIPLETRFHQ
jgi:hypothetical protein